MVLDEQIGNPTEDEFVTTLENYWHDIQNPLTRQSIFSQDKTKRMEQIKYYWEHLYKGTEDDGSSDQRTSARLGGRAGGRRRKRTRRKSQRRAKKRKTKRRKTKKIALPVKEVPAIESQMPEVISPSPSNNWTTRVSRWTATLAAILIAWGLGAWLRLDWVDLAEKNPDYQWQEHYLPTTHDSYLFTSIIHQAAKTNSLLLLRVWPRLGPDASQRNAQRFFNCGRTHRVRCRKYSRP